MKDIIKVEIIKEFDLIEEDEGMHFSPDNLEMSL
jgi:hypothetical protein